MGEFLDRRLQQVALLAGLDRQMGHPVEIGEGERGRRNTAGQAADQGMQHPVEIGGAQDWADFRRHPLVTVAGAFTGQGLGVGRQLIDSLRNMIGGRLPLGVRQYAFSVG